MRFDNPRERVMVGHVTDLFGGPLQLELGAATLFYLGREGGGPQPHPLFQLVAGQQELGVLGRQLPAQCAQLDVCTDARHNLRDLQRLRHVVDATGIKALQLVLQIVEGCHEDDRDVAGRLGCFQATA
jgi:hypothetical protein